MGFTLRFMTQLFPLWAILLAALGYFLPAAFVDMKPAIIPLLALIMLGMGMTLTLDDFKRVITRPVIILIGLALQFLVMPLAAFLVSQALDLPLALLTGMVLVGVSAGGTASNVICYLAKGDVALSITLTLCSTLAAVIAMPLLTWLYIGQQVPVPVVDMLFTVAKIILIPVFIGVLINQFGGHVTRRATRYFPVISVMSIALIIAIIVAINRQRIADVTGLVIVAVMLHNMVGLFAGYWVARWAGYEKRISRTLAIEVGMQNSGLSVALAIKYYSPLAALPGAIFSIWHNISGSLLASLWARHEKHAFDGRKLSRNLPDN